MMLCVEERVEPKKLVLLVEDQAYDEALTLRGLSSFTDSIAIEIVRNGREAVDRLRSGVRPDAIILDLKLPFYNGREILAGAADGIPVYVFTDSAEEVDQDACAGLGARGFFTKPLDVAQYAVVVDQIAKTLLAA